MVHSCTIWQTRMRTAHWHLKLTNQSIVRFWILYCWHFTHTHIFSIVIWFIIVTIFPTMYSLNSYVNLFLSIRLNTHCHWASSKDSTGSFIPVYNKGDQWIWMLWGEVKKAGSHREPGVKPKTPLAWAASALPLSHDSCTTTNPHNPLYVLHRWYWMPQSHTRQPFSLSSIFAS